MFPAVFVLLATLSVAPLAQNAERELQKGAQQAARLEYETAFQTLERLATSLPPEHPLVARAHLYAGCVAVVVGRDESARTHFTWVLARNPSARLVGPDSDSPKIQAFFEGIRDEMRLREGKVEGRVAPNEEAPPPRPSTLVLPKPIWISLWATTALSAATAVAGTMLALEQDDIAGDRTRSNFERRQAQEKGRLWLAVGISGALLGAAGLTGAVVLAPEGE